MTSRIKPISIMKQDNMIDLVDRVFECQLEKQPELEEKMNERDWEICKEDIEYHISYLLSAMEMDSMTLFQSYMKWVRAFMSSIGIAIENVKIALQCSEMALGETLPLDKEQKLHSFIEEGIRVLDSASEDIPSFMGDDPSMSVLATQYLNTLLQGDRQIASKMILDAVEEGISIKDIYLKVFEPVLHEIGRLWQTNKIIVAEEHYCTAATQLIMSQLYPQVMNTGKSSKTIVATCIAGELHEIGVRMVADLFEMSGWNSYYMGANTPTSSIIETLKERNADILAISATITTNIPSVRDLIEAVRKDSELNGLKIIVGGNPFFIDPDLWRRVRADGTAETAEKAVEMAEEIIR